MKDYYIALLHYPVYNRRREVVTTAVANMDVHDIARAAKTYGIRRYYIVNPIEAQRELVRKILDHWLSGYGAAFNPARKAAFETVALCRTLDDVLADITALSNRTPKLVVTGAALSGEVMSFPAMRRQMEQDDDPYLFVFGTGSGLSEEVVVRGDHRLAPVRGEGHYNHLSVRSAVAIVLDRLFAT
jgi:hypothetical protein